MARMRFCALNILRTAPLRVQRCHRCVLTIQRASAAQLEAYLSTPERPLRALLNRRKVVDRGDGRFLYQSRPYALLSFRVSPEVTVRAVWADRASGLTILFERCTIHGLGALDSLVHFACEARIVPQGDQLVAEAELALETHGVASALPIPDRLLRPMGERALDLVVARLEKRCRHGLVQAAERWIAAHPSSGDS